MTELAGAPLLAGLDPRARADVRAAARHRELAPGGVAFAPGDPADTLWFVETGVMLLETPRGPLSVGPGEHFGDEALLRGAVRASRAWSPGQSALFEISVPALERILVRAGAAGALLRQSTLARRRASVALLADTPLGSALGARALDEVVAEAHEATVARGATLFEANQAALSAFVVVGGLVELSCANGEKSFAARGELLGAEAALAATTYDATATALGELALLRLSADQLALLALRHAPALEHARASGAARRERQRRVRDVASARATRHAFHELERLESARSLLAIELDRCARCGQCVSACAETHGTPRLERRGEKVTLALAESGAPPRALLLPRACQHCKVPDCVSACPTGAITRTAGAAVTLELELCTGCGACAKACPWDAVRMEPRAGGAAEKSPLVAAKCDLCAGGEGPECVSACPTGAIFRADPARDLVEARALFGAKSERAPRPTPRRTTRAVLLLAALVPPLLAVGRSGAVAFSRERAFTTGAFAGALTLLLLAHGVIKRARPVRAWLVRRGSGRFGRGLGPFVTAHAVLGVTALAVVLAHAGTAPVHGAAGALRLVFWLLAASGAFGALAYRVVPARLTRLERRGSVPEDHAAELDALEQRLYGRLSEQNAALKECARRVLVPYARAWYGPLALVISGRSLGQEEAAFGAALERLLGGKKSERLSALSELANVAVALRALAARRWLERLLAAWLPLHLALSALLVVLLAVHVAGALR